MQVFLRRLGIGRQKQQIAVPLILPGELPVHRPGQDRKFQNTPVRVQTQHPDPLRPGKGLCHGAPDEPQADNAYGHAFIASSSFRIRPLSSVNCSGVRDWAPSHRA